MEGKRKILVNHLEKLKSFIKIAHSSCSLSVHILKIIFWNPKQIYCVKYWYERMAQYNLVNKSGVSHWKHVFLWIIGNWHLECAIFLKFAKYTLYQMFLHFTTKSWWEMFSFQRHILQELYSKMQRNKINRNINGGNTN